MRHRTRIVGIVMTGMLFGGLAAGGETRAANVQVSPDGGRVLVGKDVGAERWSITRTLDDLTVTGNVFRSDGGDPAFLFCEQQGQSGDDVALACSAADACSDSACPGFEFLADVTLPASFFEPPVATDAIVARIAAALEPAPDRSVSRDGGQASRGSGIQRTPDGRRILINKDVGDERWSITRDLDDLTVTGNVFRSTGGPPVFLYCEPQGQNGDDVALACSGADACSDTTCPDFAFLADVTLPESFFMPPSDTAAPGSTRIEGRVRDVVENALGAREGAASPAAVSGIPVELLDGDEVVDVATTDLEGRFVLEFEGGGDFELVFAVDDVLVTLALTILPGSVVRLEVDIRVPEDRVVVIDRPDVDSPPILCGPGGFAIFDEGLDLVVDGRGDDCVRALGNCTLDLVVGSLTLVDCGRCIAAHGNSQIFVTAVSGPVVCESRADGIRTQGNASVVVEGFSGIDLFAGAHAIGAAGASTVTLASDGICAMDGAEGAIRIDGNAAVDTLDCAAIDLASEATAGGR